MNMECLCFPLLTVVFFCRFVLLLLRRICVFTATRDPQNGPFRIASIVRNGEVSLTATTIRSLVKSVKWNWIIWKLNSIVNCWIDNNTEHLLEFTNNHPYPTAASYDYWWFDACDLREYSGVTLYVYQVSKVWLAWIRSWSIYTVSLRVASHNMINMIIVFLCSGRIKPRRAPHSDAVGEACLTVPIWYLGIVNLQWISKLVNMHSLEVLVFLTWPSNLNFLKHYELWIILVWCIILSMHMIWPQAKASLDHSLTQSHVGVWIFLFSRIIFRIRCL